MTPTSDQKERLANCPFCGSRAELREQWGTDRRPFEVVCMARIGCHATSGDWGRTSDAISAWNRRVPAEQRVERECIVGYAKCGCLVTAASVRAEPFRIYELAEDMRGWEADGLRLGTASVETVRTTLGCTHVRPIAAEEEKAE